jgi:CRP-like cAMP-binding protein
MVLSDPRSTANGRAPSETVQTRNRLLAVLPVEDYQRLAPALELVPLTRTQILHTPGERIQHVYFPGGGFCSIWMVLAARPVVEIALIGREGMVGVSAMWGAAPVTAVTIVQGGTDTCYRLAVAPFRREVDRRGRFAELLTHFGEALFGSVAQSAGCNALHSVEQRLARRLLMASDRIESEDFPLTHELAATMLGTTRPTVTLVASTLQKAGLIRYHRGHMTILDREQLKRTSCECYAAVTASLLAVTALPPRPHAPAPRRSVTTAGMTQRTSRSRT